MIKDRGFLLINLGTPDSTSTGDVRRYLRQFLSDARVIDIPATLRWLLLNLIILPLRPRKSAEAYRAIWTKEGSPLLLFTKQLAERVQSGTKRSVKFAMRYGSPSIESALRDFAREGVRKIRVLPLYPQYAAASTASSIAELYECAARMNDPFELDVLPPFYEDAGFIEAQAELVKPVLQKVDHVLMSFHGLPERQIRRSAGELCATENCCENPGDRLALCYRAQSFRTAKALAAKLGIASYSVSFQSRLGRTPWIKPYTDHVLQELGAQGKRLAVVCPSFTADCLETLEEINIRGRADFLKAGGKEFHYVPCVNAEESWVKRVADWAEAP
jgi:ferrochelatase